MKYENFIEKLDHINKIKSFLDDEITNKLSSIDSQSPIYNLLSTRPELKENIEKIKLKYGYSSAANKIETSLKIQQLKRKYKNNNINKYSINPIDKISYIADTNEIKNNFKKTYNSNWNHNLKLTKENEINLPFPEIMKNYTKTEQQYRINRGFSSDKLLFNNYDNQNYENYFPRKNSSYNQYIKNEKEEFNAIDKKVNEILENEKCECPISKRINILTEIKKEINQINKNSVENDNNISQLSYNSYYTLGFKYIKPKIKGESIFGEVFNSNNNKENNNYFSDYEDEVSKPVLIKTMPKPKFKVLNFQNFCERNEE